MLAIRLRRAGSKNRPFYRVVVTESRSAREGRFVEVLGFYNPRTKPETLTVKRDRLEHWLKLGAQGVRHCATIVDRIRTAGRTRPSGAGAAWVLVVARRWQPAGRRQRHGPSDAAMARRAVEAKGQLGRITGGGRTAARPHACGQGRQLRGPAVVVDLRD